eukprot:1184474-Prorocentrum_minimum.AAC.2
MVTMVTQVCVCFRLQVIAADLGEELVVTSLKEYEERAVALATNRTPALRADCGVVSPSNISPTPGGGTGHFRSRLHKIRARIAESRMALGGVFDTRAYAKKLVKGFHLAWENFLAGNQPMHISSF